MLLESNLNHTVIFKLSENGIKMLKQKHESDSKAMPESIRISFESRFKIDENNDIEIQMWQAMNIFGPHMYNGNNNTTPFRDMNFKIKIKG